MIAALTFFCPLSLVSQVALEERLCEDCAIVRELVVTISDTGFPGGAIGAGGVVHANRDGTYLVISGARVWDELFLANRDGLVERRVGRTGRGPGEFLLPIHISESDSAYIVLDGRLGRATLLDKHQLGVLRSQRLPAKISRVPPLALPDNRLVVVGTVPTREYAGFSLFLLSGQGDVLATFGTSTVATPIAAGPTPTALAASGDSAFWAAYDDYRLELWHLDGRLLGEYQRVADWINPRSSGMKEGDSYSFLSGLREDEERRLWVHMRLGKVGPRGGTSTDPAAFQSIIEVIEADSVIVSQSQEGTKDLVVPGSRFLLKVTAFDSRTGLTQLQIWSSRILEGRSPKQ